MGRSFSKGCCEGSVKAVMLILYLERNSISLLVVTLILQSGASQSALHIEDTQWMMCLTGLNPSLAHSAKTIDSTPRCSCLGMYLWNQSRPCGAPRHKPFCVPPFLFLGNRLQPPWRSLSSKGQVQTLANQGREGMQRPGRNSQETMAHPWGRVLVPLQGIYITRSLSSSAELTPPTNENLRGAH